MPGAVPYSHWSELLGKTTSTRRTCPSTQSIAATLVSAIRKGWTEEPKPRQPEFGGRKFIAPPNQRPSKAVLGADASGPIRDRLVNEIAALDVAETPIEWAGQNLGAMDTLAAEDASNVEAAFLDRMRVLEPDVYSPSEAPVDPTICPAETAQQPSPQVLPARPPPLRRARFKTDSETEKNPKFNHRRS